PIERAQTTPTYTFPTLAASKCQTSYLSSGGRSSSVSHGRFAHSTGSQADVIGAVGEGVQLRTRPRLPSSTPPPTSKKANPPRWAGSKTGGTLWGVTICGRLPQVNPSRDRFV